MTPAVVLGALTVALVSLLFAAWCIIDNASDPR